LIWLGLAVGMLFLVGYVVSKHENRLCKEIIINVNRTGGDDFITENDLLEYILAQEDSLKNKPMKDINLYVLESIIAENPYILSSSVYAGLDGVIYIEVAQRRPIVKVQSLRDDPFYISEDGRLMPVSPKRPARVLFASGHFNFNIHTPYYQKLELDISEPKNKADSLVLTNDLYRIYQIARCVDTNEFFKAQVSQLYLNADGEFAIIPLVGDQVIILGDEKDLAEKLENLEIFYKQALSVEGWDKYDTINLKFRNQVVCSLKQN
jgi:cell division protein FtsQ